MKTAKILGYEEEFPIVEVKRSKSGNRVVFKCPSCGRIIYHGACGPRLGSGDGHRVPDHHGANCQFIDGYILKEVP